MSNQKTFVELCLNCDAIPEVIDDFVGHWHAGEGADQSIHDYLGMSLDDYSLWVEKPSALNLILYRHAKRVTLREAIEAAGNFSIATRAESPEVAEDILRWLKSTGRIPSSPANEEFAR